MASVALGAFFYATKNLVLFAEWYFLYISSICFVKTIYLPEIRCLKIGSHRYSK